MEWVLGLCFPRVAESLKQCRSESQDLGFKRTAPVPVMESQDACPHLTQVPYLSAAVVLGTPSAACSAGKSRGLALSSGLRLRATEREKNTGQPWLPCSASYRRSPCTLPLPGRGLSMCVVPPTAPDHNSYVEILTSR